ncbi:MAG: hypothetical protein AAF654_00750 [Myxococcota bacterium]
MRIRRLHFEQFSDQTPTELRSALSVELEPIGYTARGEGFFRGGVLLREEVEPRDGAVEYGFYPFRSRFLALTAVLAAAILASTAFWAPRLIGWIGWEHRVLVLLVYAAVGLFFYAPMSWTYGWVASVSARRERQTLECLARAAGG